MLNRAVRQSVNGILSITSIRLTGTILISKLKRVMLLKTDHEGIDLKLKQLELNEKLTRRLHFE